MAESKPIDEATWNQIAALAVNRAFMLGGRGELKPPITITIDDDEGTILQFRLPALDGSVEVGELSPIRVDRVVRWPLRVLFEDAGGQNAFESKLDGPAAPTIQ
ncbi:MAG: hypothetical protein ABSG54_07650 [Terriglobia bacterium]|jgi:hypothetical protein